MGIITKRFAECGSAFQRRAFLVSDDGGLVCPRELTICGGVACKTIGMFSLVNYDVFDQKNHQTGNPTWSYGNHHEEVCRRVVSLAPFNDVLFSSIFQQIKVGMLRAQSNSRKMTYHAQLSAYGTSCPLLRHDVLPPGGQDALLVNVCAMGMENGEIWSGVGEGGEVWATVASNSSKLREGGGHLLPKGGERERERERGGGGTDKL